MKLLVHIWQDSVVSTAIPACGLENSVCLNPNQTCRNGVMAYIKMSATVQKIPVYFNNYRVFQKKNAQSLMHHSFTTVRHRVM